MKTEEWVYKVILYTGVQSDYIVAKSMIDAARKYTGKSNLKKGILNGHKIPWLCKVYKYKKNNYIVPYAEGYYIENK